MKLKNKYSPICFLPPPRDEFDTWKEICDPNITPGMYFVNTYSDIFSFKYGELLKPIINHGGYLIVSLNANPLLGLDKKHRFQRKIHRLSMIAFNPIEGYENYQINHRDGNKFNNHISNLEWVTPQENIDHSIKYGLRNFENLGQKINSDIARYVKFLLSSNNYTHKEIVKIIGEDIITEVIVNNIATGKSWINV